METDAFLFIGGCSGGFTAPTQLVPTWAPQPSRTLAHERFERTKHGSLTTSFWISHGASNIIIDQGSGIAHTAKVLIEKMRADRLNEVKVDVLMTHWHQDHIGGIPQNSLLFHPNMRLRFFSPDLSAYNPPVAGEEPQSVERLLSSYFNPKKGIWPVELSELDSVRDFVNFKPDQTEPLYVGEKNHIRVNTMPLNHKGGCSAYQICLPDHGPIVILTDHEPGLDPDPRIVAWLEGASLAVLDMQYSDAEYAGDVALGGMKRSRVGWGHGTPNRWFPHLLACQTPPQRVLITHHDPTKSDDALFAFREESQRQLSSMNRRTTPINLQFAEGGRLYWLP